MVEIESLLFSYPRSEFRLSIPELKIADGEKVAIIGPSGCGKTTLLNLISGIIGPQSGSIKVDGKMITSLSPAQRRDFRIRNIGQVFQQFELVDYLRAKDNITLPYLINSSLRLTADVRQTVLDITSSMGMADKLKRFPSQLSQGEQQRIAICRALITKPKLLLADEPTGNLDPSNKLTILQLLFEQCVENGHSLVVVTHDTGILGGFDRTIDFNQFLKVRDNLAEAGA